MNILSFDGGGVFGALSIGLVAKLERACPDYLRSVDMIAGTSTGGIIALALASGYSAKDVLEFYRNLGKTVFAPDLKRKVVSGDGLLSSRYSNGPLRETLKKLLGDQTMVDLKKKVLIPAFHLDDEDPATGTRMWRTRFFDNTSKDFVVDVALRTSAAPCLFPSHQGYVDGGLTVNNPSMSAVAECLSKGHDLKDIRLLSVGTGLNAQFVEGDVSWGAVRWAVPVLKVMLLAGMDVQDYHCQQFLKEGYFRLNAVTRGAIQMDDASKIPLLIETADKTDISKAVEWVEFSRGTGLLHWAFRNAF